MRGRFRLRIERIEEKQPRGNRGDDHAVAISFVLLALLFPLGFVYKALNEESPLHSLHSIGDGTPPSEIFELDHPAFADIRQHEATLPQHHMPTSVTQTRPRYVYFPCEVSAGWNNVFQEQLLNTHLAYLAGRGYVFVDYIARHHPPFRDTLANGTRLPLHIPMNAFTAGPTGGGSLGDGVDPAISRAISLAWWDTVCRQPQIIEIQMTEMVQELNITESSTGEERLMRWAEKLRNIGAECVKVVGGSPFDLDFIGSDKVISIWPSYRRSPALKEFAWSALVTRALSRNFSLFSSGWRPAAISPSPWYRINPGKGSTSSPYPLSAFSPYRVGATPIAGLLAIHVRRGDYAKHCYHLVELGLDYNAWNIFGRPDIRSTSRYPQLPDYLSVPDGQSRAGAAYTHCWPSPTQMVERVRAVRAASGSGRVFPAQRLHTVYVATNGNAEWVRVLVDLLKADGWAKVSTSLEMRLARDELAVSQAVDMAVLMSAETFIGVGFSSLSSNVVQLRLAGGRHPETNRFW
ncbi:hypothetical protein DFH07DRAFT_786890 [Mycena maculata]|uniref:Uncharacterized protein n=1 Tax=Mycena maculata TaxID=230809 RepID=A0AAD7P220_9AGAR|nr:hypothetical protein DFH07DRAFT_786890 [Mycena maculata]